VNSFLRCHAASVACAWPHENQKETRISDPRTNDRIRVPEVRLVDANGEQVGVVRIEDALRLAQEADLDLVEISPTSKPPVAKIMDFGKYKYETAQKAKEARRNQANTILKEVRFRLKIDTHDYETKRKRAEGFLQSGDKVKAMILFRGREQSRPEQGVRLLQKFAEDVAEFGSVESTPTIDGRNMVMVIGPLKNKAEAKAEAQARQAANRPPRTSGGGTDAAKPAAVRPAAEKPAVEAPALETPTVETPAPEVKPPAAPKAAAAPKAPATPKAPAAPKAATPKTTATPRTVTKTEATAAAKPAAAPKKDETNA
jgi:translation initiation factor IF-3